MKAAYVVAVVFSLVRVAHADDATSPWRGTTSTGATVELTTSGGTASFSVSWTITCDDGAHLVRLDSGAVPIDATGAFSVQTDKLAVSGLVAGTAASGTVTANVAASSPCPAAAVTATWAAAAPAMDNTAAAQAMYTQALSLIVGGDQRGGEEILTNIGAKYPGTPAATEATAKLGEIAARRDADRKWKMSRRGLVFWAWMGIAANPAAFTPAQNGPPTVRGMHVDEGFRWTLPSGRLALGWSIMLDPIFADPALGGSEGFVARPFVASAWWYPGGRFFEKGKIQSYLRGGVGFGFASKKGEMDVNGKPISHSDTVFAFSFGSEIRSWSWFAWNLDLTFVHDQTDVFSGWTGALTFGGTFYIWKGPRHDR